MFFFALSRGRWPFPIEPYNAFRSDRFLSVARHYSSTNRTRSKMTLPHLPDVSSVSPRVLRILGCNPGFMTLQGTNTYVVGTGKRRILIDTGEPDFPEYIKNLHETMIKYDFQLNDIILTHWHRDHIGGVKNVLDMISNKNECKVWKFSSEDDIKREYNFQFNSMKNKQEFNIEGATLKIHHTPGHTADHVVITLVEDNALFSADTVLGEGTTVFEDLNDYLNSLNLILDLKPSVIFPGHGSVVKDPINRVNRYINHRLEREKEIYDLIKKCPNESVSEEDLVKKMYQIVPSDYKKIALYTIQKHLIKLEKDNKIIKVGEKWQKSKL